MDANHKTIAYVRSQESPRMAPPVTNSGVVGWLKENLFASTRDTVLTILTFLLLLWMVPPILDWAFISAVWTGESREDCIVPGAGACWAFVEAKFGQFIYGRYPLEERWRVDLTGLLLIAGLVPIAIPSVPYKRENALYLLVVFPILAFILLTGQFGLEPVETALWGGLLVTLVVAIVGIVVSFPLGILLALGRRSEMPIIKLFCIIFIEFWRGVPLITVLFMSSVMLPLFLPEGVTFDKLLRALIGVALFSSAYMAEVVRGGLAGHPQRASMRRHGAWADLLADDESDRPAAGPETGDPGHRQHLHRPVQGHDPGADHRPVRSSRPSSSRPSDPTGHPDTRR
jgi:general L-amino acid transport system permease protein